MKKHRPDIRYVSRHSRRPGLKCHICGLLSEEVEPGNREGHKWHDSSVNQPLCSECQPHATNAELALKAAGFCGSTGN
jgi:hypothetical protein